VKEINFKDLSLHSDLFNIINNSTNKDIKYKTRKEIIREFNNEKWADVINKIKNNKDIKLQEVDEQMECFEKISTFYFNKKFYLATGKESFNKHLELYSDLISNYINDASALVELGAGYGSKILNLSSFEALNKLQLFAGEFTENGCESIKFLSDRMNKLIKVGRCDLEELMIDELKIPENSIIFTSYALHYIKEISKSFIDSLLKYNPKIVIHFEPCYEHHSNSSYGKMCKRYIELNDYNLNMISVFKNAEKNKKIILDIEENVIGSNPFLPVSVIKWRST